METLRRYLKQERGRASRLAEALDVQPSAISQWAKVPPERVLEVERITGLPRYELRPDIYGAAPRRQRAAA
jgi:DNA-binding transcriptional regulator YdaS (Cro superfamily)